jgi:hypothetical protein
MLTGDVPSQHLMRPVQSTGRQHQGRPAGSAPDQSVGEQCARAERRTVLIIPSTRSFPCTPKIRRSRASGHKKIAPATIFVAPSAIFFMSLGPHVGAQYLCACPPLAIKGEACDVTHKLNLQTQSQAHKLIQAHKQYITQWSRVLHSGGPNHSKPSCVLVFFPFSQLTSETPRPLLILGFRAGALRHPARDFLSDIWCAR